MEGGDGLAAERCPGGAREARLGPWSWLCGRGALPGGSTCHLIRIDALAGHREAPHGVPMPTATMLAENGNVTMLASG